MPPFTEIPTSVKRSLKRSARRMLTTPPFGVLRRYFQGLGSCLLYHRVTTTLPDSNQFQPYLGLSVHQDRFDEQMRYLSQHFHCLPLDEAITRLAKDQLSPKTAIVTFDDGYLDNLTLALPILERYHVPATIYVTTGFIDRTARMWWYEIERAIAVRDSLSVELPTRSLHCSLRTMLEKLCALRELNTLLKCCTAEEQSIVLDQVLSGTDVEFSYDEIMLHWEQVAALARHPLITIGAHTCSHPVLRQLDDMQLSHELSYCRTVLEQRTGVPVLHFAYPFGGPDQVGVREANATAAAGFRSAFTTAFGHLQRAHRTRLYALPRITIDYYDSLAQFAQKLNGIDAMIAHRGRRLA